MLASSQRPSLALAACLCALAPAARGGAGVPDALRERVQALLEQVEAQRPERWPGIAQDLARIGPDAVAACVERLAGACSGDATAASPVQAQVLFDALLRLPRPALREHFEHAARTSAGTCEKLVGLRLLARMGEAGDVLLATRLADPGADEPLVEPALRAAYGQALDGIVAREPPSSSAFARAYGEVHDGLTASLVRALGRRRDGESLAALAELLGREEAADALLLIEIGRHGRHVELPADPEVLARVQAGLDSPRAEVAAEAAVALGELEDTGAVPRLLDLVGGARIGAARAAERALVRLGDVDHGSDADAWRAWYEAEARWWNDSAPQLLADLGGGDAQRVAPALMELARHPLWRDSIAPHLESAVARPEIELAVLACAVTGRLGSRLGAPALRAALESSAPRLRREARAALALLERPSRPPNRP